MRALPSLLRREHLAIVALLAVAVLWSASARADLLSDVDTLIAVWTRGGAEVDRRAPVFISAGETRRLSLDVEPRAGECVTVTAIASRPLRFGLQAVDGVRPSGSGVTSEAGVASLEDCGTGLLANDVLLRLEAGRGTVELVVVRHARAIAPVPLILPVRAVGPVAPQADDGGPLVLAPAADRVSRVRRAARLDGAELVVPVPLSADGDGKKALILKLREGCHRVVVVADQANSPNGSVDVDAEVVLAGEEALLSRDRSHAPDARLDFCIGQTERVELRFVGAGASSPVTVIDALWALPTGIPTRWETAGRAALAWALHRRHAPTITDSPIAEYVGPPGSTLLPLELEPGGCYLAAFAVPQGEASAGRLTVRVGAEFRHDETADGPTSGAVTFCALGHEQATAQIDLRARRGWWRFAMWRLGGPK